MDLSTPYENLNPHLILTAIESVGFICDGSLQALNSYENRVYQVGIENAAPMIAKFYRPYRWSNESLKEEHQFSQELAEYEIPVVAPWRTAENETLYHYQGFRFALFARFSGRALELDNITQLEWMGRFIGRIHAVSACRPFQHRRRIDVQTYGYEPYRFLLENNFIPEYMRPNYSQTIESLLQRIEEQFELVSPLRYIRLHGDMHAGNVLWSATGPHIVDLDDCLMGPAIQDIWMLLSGNESQMQMQIDKILNGYNQFYDFDTAQLQLIEPLRALRMLHYSAWLARRWADPAFPLNFPWFNTPAYWQEQLHSFSEMLGIVS